MQPRSLNLLLIIYMYGNLSIPMLRVTIDHTLLVVIIEIYQKKEEICQVKHHSPSMCSR